MHDGLSNGAKSEFSRHHRRAKNENNVGMGLYVWAVCRNPFQRVRAHEGRLDNGSLWMAVQISFRVVAARGFMFATICCATY